MGVRYQRRFFRTLGWKHQTGAHLGGAQSQRHGQGAAYRPQRAGQRQLPGKLVLGQGGPVDLAAGRQNAQGNRQIQPPGVFGQVCRGQIDRNTFVMGKFEPAVLDGAAHPFARLFDLHIGQTDQTEAGQAIGQVHLHRDLHRV